MFAISDCTAHSKWALLSPTLHEEMGDVLYEIETFTGTEWSHAAINPICRTSLLSCLSYTRYTAIYTTVLKSTVANINRTVVEWTETYLHVLANLLIYREMLKAEIFHLPDRTFNSKQVPFKYKSCLSSHSACTAKCEIGAMWGAIRERQFLGMYW